CAPAGRWRRSASPTAGVSGVWATSNASRCSKPSRAERARLHLLITVSGPPGSGTTTAAEHVAARLELALVPGGAVFRSMAAERGLSLGAFGRYATDNPEVDAELDGRLADRARQGDVVIESRLAGGVAGNEGLLAARAWIDCDPDIRARRVAAREGVTVARARAENDER